MKFSEDEEVGDALEILLISDNSREPVPTIIQRSANRMIQKTKSRTKALFTLSCLKLNVT
jgi:hypothetical protein